MSLFKVRYVNILFSNKKTIRISKFAPISFKYRVKAFEDLLENATIDLSELRKLCYNGKCGSLAPRTEKLRESGSFVDNDCVACSDDDVYLIHFLQFLTQLI